MSNHVTTRKITVQLPDGPATLVLRPGIKPPDAANDLIFRVMKEMPHDHVFVAGPGSIATALWAARQGRSADVQITAWSDNVNWAACLLESFALAGYPQPCMHLQAGFENMATSSCASALIHLPRGRKLQEEFLHLCAAVLKPGGKLVFVGAKREGVKSAVKCAQDIFKHAGTVAYKDGYHVGIARRPSGDQRFAADAQQVASDDYQLPQLEFTQRAVSINEQTFQLISCPGVFAAGKLDGGAAALIASMAVLHDLHNQHVLDMGCGTGLVGLNAAHSGAAVTCTDVSARAVESTRRTLAANHAQATVLHTSGAESCPAGFFDTVFTNPPFHKGHSTDYETTKYFIQQAKRVLVPGGKLHLVANAFLNYKPWIEEDFTNVQEIVNNRAFVVWQGTKR